MPTVQLQKLSPYKRAARPYPSRSCKRPPSGIGGGVQRTVSNAPCAPRYEHEHLGRPSSLRSSPKAWRAARGQQES